jgi:hypothetical protein
VIANPYAAVNELVEAFTLDHAQMQAAEPFAPDFWYRAIPTARTWCCWAACRSQTRRAQTVGAALTRTFALPANGSAYALTMERWQGHCRGCVPLMHQETRRW